MMKHFLYLLLFIVTACAPIPILPTVTMPSPSATDIASTRTPVILPTPTATPTFDQLIQPYTIEGLRTHRYQSGGIHIREILFQNEFYTIYYIDYPSDGLTITGVMSIPAWTGPFPVIVMNHGYFNRADFYSGDGTDRASEVLVKRGYITLSSDYRSWGDSDIGPSLFYSGLAIDVINLMNAIPSIPQADAARVGMWGHSMGGGVTMKVLAIDSRVKAAVLYSTVSADFSEVIDRWGVGCYGDIATGEKLIGCNSSDIVPDDLPDNLQDAYFLAANDPEQLKLVSPFYYLHDVTIPVQINYGTDDGKSISGTPPEWSQKLYQGFWDAGNKHAEIFGYDGQTHSFKADEWFAFMERTGKFFDQYVKEAGQ